MAARSKLLVIRCHSSSLWLPQPHPSIPHPFIPILFYHEDIKCSPIQIFTTTKPYGEDNRAEIKFPKVKQFHLSPPRLSLSTTKKPQNYHQQAARSQVHKTEAADTLQTGVCLPVSDLHWTKYTKTAATEIKATSVHQLKYRAHASIRAEFATSSCLT